MKYAFYIMTNDNISERSLRYYEQDNVFSFDFGKSSKDFMADANQGILYPDNYGLRAGIRTLPRANDSNWAISAVFKLNRLSEARYAVSFLKHYTNPPQIVQSIRKEIQIIEKSRYERDASFTGVPEIGWKKITNVCHRPRYTIEKINQLLLSELTEQDIDFQHEGKGI